MVIGIYADPDKAIREDLDRYEQILDFNGINHITLDVSKPDFWSELRRLDLFIFHWGGTVRQHQLAPTILHMVENVMGIPCYPNFVTWWNFDDKIRGYYLLKQHSFPAIPAWVFWNEAEARAWLETAVLPVVFKLKSGASSQNVFLVKDRAYAKKLIRKMFGSGILSGHVPGYLSLRRMDFGPYSTTRRYCGDLLRQWGVMQPSPYTWLHRDYTLFQQFLPNNSFDTRITIIGRKAFASRRHVRRNDFRASGSGNDDWSQDNVDRRCITLAFEISQRIGFQCMSYDFLYDEHKQPLISEISYASPDWTVWSCPGYWDENMGWHEGHLWPQYCILSDVLKIPGLKQPDMAI